MKKILSISLIAFVLLMTSCFKDENLSVKGKKPIYIERSVFQVVKSEEAKPFTKVGKIFKIGSRIFISDVGSGVHVIDNSDATNPQKEAFISIYANRDMAVKGNIMYADNSSDLLAIDISDISQVVVKKRLESIYEDKYLYYPVDFDGYFECEDEEKGFVIDWVDADLINPECRR